MLRIQEPAEESKSMTELDELVREGARRMLKDALEAEVAEYIGRRHIARMARAPSETKKTTTSSIAAEFRRLRPGIQAERMSLISWAQQF